MGSDWLLFFPVPEKQRQKPPVGRWICPSICWEGQWKAASAMIEGLAAPVQPKRCWAFGCHLSLHPRAVIPCHWSLFPQERCMCLLAREGKCWVTDPGDKFATYNDIQMWFSFWFAKGNAVFLPNSEECKKCKEFFFYPEYLAILFLKACCNYFSLFSLILFHSHYTCLSPPVWKSIV